MAFQILQLLKTRGTHGVSLDDVLTLMVYATSLGGSSVFSQRDEYALTNLLSHAIVEDKLDLSDNLLEISEWILALRTCNGIFSNSVFDSIVYLFFKLCLIIS